METLHLLRPYWLLALLPLTWLLYRWYRNAAHQNEWRDHVDEGLLPHLISGSSTPMARTSIVVVALLWLLAVIALAGPSWEKLPAVFYRGLQE